MNRKTSRAPESGGNPVGISAPSKINTVIDLLQRKEGATLAELVDATGWLSHTVRAALTGLRKKGHKIAKGQRDGITNYRINKLR